MEKGRSAVGVDHAWPAVEIANAESFNAKLFSDEHLNVNLFTSLADAREKIEAWRQDYNGVGPTAP